jgi:DNA-binding NtrC family response regulator
MSYDVANFNTITIQVGTPLTEVERLVVEATLQHAGWNMSRCAGMLGIDFGSLFAKLKAYYLAELSKGSASPSSAQSKGQSDSVAIKQT